MSTTPLFDDDREAAAVLSECRAYRYVLRRGAGHGTDAVNFVLLNPSAADEALDDPTVRRCLGYAREWGYANLVVTNLFAWKATDPRALRTAPDPIGPENDRHLVEQAKRASSVVCGWGVHGTLLGRSAAVRRMLAEAGVGLACLAVTKGGEPGHPLYLPRSLDAVPYPGWVGEGTDAL